MKLKNKASSRKIKINYKWAVLFLVIVLAALFSYLFFSYFYFSKSLFWKDINVEGLKLKENGSNYDVVNGDLTKDNTKRKLNYEINPLKLIENDKVLRLALFYQITKEDPLFIGPGLDKEQYKKSIDRLEEVHKNLLNVTGFKENIIPIDLLKKTAEVMEAQDNFEKDKSLDNARLLLRKYKEINKIYKNEATNLGNKLKDTEIASSSGMFMQYSSVTSKDIILSDFEKIIKNYNFLAKEIKKRELCLNFSTYYCKRSSIKENLEKETKVEPEKEENVRILGNGEIYYIKDPKELTLSKPYKITSSCWRGAGDENGYHYLYEMEEYANGIKRLIPKIATNNYYIELGKGGVGKQYKRHGLDWRIALLTTPYACNDLEYQPMLATINAYYKKYKDKNILSDLKTETKEKLPKEYKKIIEDGADAEEIFFQEKFPSERTLNSLSLYYAKIYSFIINEQQMGNKEEWLNDLSNIKDELLKRHLFIQRKFGDFEGVISLFSYFLNSYLQTTDFSTGNKEVYIYYLRNSYSITFLGFSSSVWRSAEPLQYIDQDKSKIMDGIKDYDEMIKEFGKEYTDKITNMPRALIWYEILGHYIE